jgi:hypothetical protein
LSNALVLNEVEGDKVLIFNSFDVVHKFINT